MNIIKLFVFYMNLQPCFIYYAYLMTVYLNATQKI